MGYRQGGPFGSFGLGGLGGSGSSPEVGFQKGPRFRDEAHFTSSYTSSFSGGAAKHPLASFRSLRTAGHSSLTPVGLGVATTPLRAAATPLAAAASGPGSLAVSPVLGKSRSEASLSRPHASLGSAAPEASSLEIRGREQQPLKEATRSLPKDENERPPNDELPERLRPTKDEARPTRTIDAEARRRTLEMLANPRIRRFAQDIFKKHGPDGRGNLTFEGLTSVLRTLHMQLDLPDPNVKFAEQQFKKFDVNGDHSLGFEEFFELFKALLRRSAFDRSSMVRREFFITKETGDVWAAYTRVKELGAGTFGKAYLVKSKSSGEERVVKAVQKSRTSMPLDDIEHEILVMRQVDHPHIVRLFEWYEDSGRFYLVLEALKGGTLKDVLLRLLKQSSSVKEAWTRKLLSQVCDAMAYCHNLRLIHKDLKDENIMLLKKDPNFDEPFAIVIDLGITEMFSTADPMGREIGGTPTTMAPEVWKGNFGPKCDVYSLGCILYELLSGNYPFMAASLQPQAWLRLHKKGPDWSRVRTSEASKDLCKKMLTYSEAARPSMLECRQHEYFSMDRQELKAVPAEQFAPFAALCQEQQLKRSLLLEIAARLPMNRAVEVIRLFESLDRDYSGHLSPRELDSFFRHAGITDEGLIEETFRALDVDQDGRLSFSEFAAGALLLFRDMLEERLLDLFRHHDSNSNGSLDVNEAQVFLEDVAAAVDKGSRGASSSVLQKLMEDAEGGRLTYEQLRQYILVPPPAVPSSGRQTPSSSAATSRVGTSRSRARG